MPQTVKPILMLIMPLRLFINRMMALSLEVMAKAKPFALPVRPKRTQDRTGRDAS